jgi:hypothetical protein
MRESILVMLAVAGLPAQLVIAVLLFAWPLEKRDRWATRLVVAIPVAVFLIPCLMMGGAIALGIIGKENSLGLNIYYSLLGYGISLLFALWICRITVWEALFCATCGYLLQHFSYCLCALLWPENANNATFLTKPGCDLVFAAAYALAFSFFARKLVENGHYPMRLDRALTTAVAALTCSLILSAIAQDMREGHEAIYNICLIYAMICCFYILINQVEIRRQLTLQHDLDVQQQLFLMNQNQYDTMAENVELINRKCHDLKHQLEALRRMPEEQRDESLRSLEDSVLVYDSIVETGNKMLDTVLTEKSLQCKARGIPFTCVADGSCLDFLEPMDLYSIFGNALDNALEGVSRLQDPELRTLSLLVMQKTGMVVVQVENPYEGELELRDGLPKTVKQNEPGYHGYGLKSIRDTVEKYGGYLTVETEGQVFLLRLLFPDGNKKM